MTMEKRRHEWLNALFQTLQSPKEQLEYLRDIYDSVLSDTARKLFDDLLLLPREKFYQDGLIKEKH